VTGGESAPRQGSIGPRIAIGQYADAEWKGSTQKANTIRQVGLLADSRQWNNHVYWNILIAAPCSILAKYHHVLKSFCIDFFSS